tara:strand:- start:349 stop:630 length:282 start_codon:yes stop_codon:yes gene_type:complete
MGSALTHSLFDANIFDPAVFDVSLHFTASLTEGLALFDGTKFDDLVFDTTRQLALTDSVLAVKTAGSNNYLRSISEPAVALSDAIVRATVPLD